LGGTTVAETLHAARGVLIDVGGSGLSEVDEWSDRVDVVTAEPGPDWPADTGAVLLRPDGYVAWAGGSGLAEALHRWFGPPKAAAPSTTRLTERAVAH
jgi:hypothetical protein